MFVALWQCYGVTTQRDRVFYQGTTVCSVLGYYLSGGPYGPTPTTRNIRTSTTESFYQGGTLFYQTTSPTTGTQADHQWWARPEGCSFQFTQFFTPTRTVGVRYPLYATTRPPHPSRFLQLSTHLLFRTPFRSQGQATGHHDIPPPPRWQGPLRVHQNTWCVQDDPP